jgi:hypothetical protein
MVMMGRSKRKGNERVNGQDVNEFALAKTTRTRYC